MDAIGLASEELHVRLEANSVFPIGSNSKLFVSVAMYQLQERGLVNLSLAVNDYLDRHDFANLGFANQTLCTLRCLLATSCAAMRSQSRVVAHGRTDDAGQRKWGTTKTRSLISQAKGICGAVHKVSSQEFLSSSHTRGENESEVKPSGIQQRPRQLVWVEYTEYQRRMLNTIGIRRITSSSGADLCADLLMACFVIFVVLVSSFFFRVKDGRASSSSSSQQQQRHHRAPKASSNRKVQ